MSKVWMLASGKGGTGKTTLAACLGIALGRMGQKVCVVDASTGLRGADLPLGLENRVVFDALDVTGDVCSLDEALVRHETIENLWLLSASQAAEADELTEKLMERLVKRLRKKFDVVLIDCPGGVERNVTDFAEIVDACILTVMPDDASIRAAERLNSLLFEKGCKEMYLAVNFVNEKWVHDGLTPPPEQLALVLDAPLLGDLPYSERVYRALLQHKTPLETNEKDFSAAISQMASRMLGRDVPFKTYRIRSRKWFRRVEG